MKVFAIALAAATGAATSQETYGIYPPLVYQGVEQKPYPTYGNFVDLNGDGLVDYVWSHYDGSTHDTRVRMNNGCRMVNARDDGIVNYCSQARVSGNQPSRLQGHSECSDPDLFTAEQVAQFLQSKEVLADGVQKLAAHMVDGATMSYMDAPALAAAGIDNALVHAQVMGQWRVLQKLYERCLRDAASRRATSSSSFESMASDWS